MPLTTLAFPLSIAASAVAGEPSPDAAIPELSHAPDAVITHQLRLAPKIETSAGGSGSKEAAPADAPIIVTARQRHQSGDPLESVNAQTFEAVQRIDGRWSGQPPTHIVGPCLSRYGQGYEMR